MRRGVKMGVLLAAFAALLCGYAAIMNMSGTQSVTEEAGSYPLWPEDSTVSALSWTQEDGTYAFTLGESVWMREGDDAFPVNQTAVQNLADKITGLTATRQLTDVSELADYGLAEPSFTVTARDGDGAEVTYAMGDATPFEDGYYLSVSGDDAVYVVESSLATTFDKTLAQLAVMEDMPAVERATRVTVGDALDIAYDEQAATWRDAATGELLDAELAQDYVDDVTALSWSELMSTGATDEELSEWMLDEAQATAVTLYEGETAARTLLLGGEDEDGNRYARLPGSRMVYTLNASDAQTVLDAGVDTLWNKTPIAMTAEEITGAAFTWEGGQRTLTAEDMEGETAQSIAQQLTALEGTERAELAERGAPVLIAALEGVRAEQGDEAVDEAVDEAADEAVDEAADEAVDEAVDEAAQAASGGEAQPDAQGGTPIEQTVEIYAYNVDSYWIQITGDTGMLVPAADVDKLIRMLRQEG